jgi:hypothetical protein
LKNATDLAPASIAPALKYAFSPVHKAALGVAFGMTCGFVIAVATVVQLLVSVDDRRPLSLLNQFFYGYQVSWTGVVIGAFWAFVVGFVAGWFLGFLKNLFTALWMFTLRVKSSLSQPFLDHI